MFHKPSSYKSAVDWKVISGFEFKVSIALMLLSERNLIWKFLWFLDSSSNRNVQFNDTWDQCSLSKNKWAATAFQPKERSKETLSQSMSKAIYKVSKDQREAKAISNISFLFLYFVCAIFSLFMSQNASDRASDVDKNLLFLRNKNSIYDFTMLIMICTTIITINASVVSNLPLHENVSKSRVLVFLGTKPRNEIYLFVRQTPTILSLGVANNYLLHRVSFSPSRCACFFPPNPVSVIIYCT